MNRKTIECKSCEVTVSITVKKSNFEVVEDVEITYCPICSVEFYEEDDDLMGYEED